MTFLSRAARDERREVELQPGRRTFEMDSPRRAAIEQLVDGIWYVDLDRVSDEAFERALPELAAGRGVVFDLRGYPNSIQPQTLFPHLIREPVKSPSWLVPIIERPDGEAWQFQESAWELKPEAPLLPERRVFLTDARAISYAESCLGIVEHYRLAEILGAPTAGTNGNVNPITIPGGYRIRWTGMKVLKCDGSRHHGVGILPTVPFEPTRDGLAEGRDELLERAVDLLASGEELSASDD